jgi:putative membrane protein
MFKPLLVTLSVLTVSAVFAQANPPAQSTAPGTTPGAAAKTTSDQNFVREASAAGLAEVADAQKALKMAKRDDVRRAAEQLLNDHQAANAKLKTLAEKKNLPLASAPKQAPPPPAGDFDSGYIASQVKAHQDAVALFKAEAEGGRDNDLREFAASTLPTLEQHLAMMQSLKK